MNQNASLPYKKRYMQGYGIVYTSPHWLLTSKARILPDPIRVEMVSSFPDLHYTWFLSGVFDDYNKIKCIIKEPWALGKTISYCDLLAHCMPLLPFFVPDPSVYCNQAMNSIPYSNRCSGSLLLLLPVAHPSTFFEMAR